jgi:hypothetical protein
MASVAKGGVFGFSAAAENRAVVPHLCFSQMGLKGERAGHSQRTIRENPDGERFGHRHSAFSHGFGTVDLTGISEFNLEMAAVTVGFVFCSTAAAQGDPGILTKKIALFVQNADVAPEVKRAEQFHPDRILPGNRFLGSPVFSVEMKRSGGAAHNDFGEPVR